MFGSGAAAPAAMQAKAQSICVRYVMLHTAAGFTLFPSFAEGGAPMRLCGVLRSKSRTPLVVAGAA